MLKKQLLENSQKIIRILLEEPSHVGQFDGHGSAFLQAGS
ncbi:hypothetical protein QE357_004614 [Siphonobacter sp. BAB-5404]|nr:hypothetical protein [Siphonobacter sp. SORGH_AS_0500]